MSTTIDTGRGDKTMSEGINADSAPANAVVVRDDWLRAIGKAASALRFVADNWEWNTEPAKAELRSIAASLTELETAIIEANCGALEVMS